MMLQMVLTFNSTTVHINVMFLFVYYSALIIHEMGHVLATKLVGGKVRKVCFGGGAKWVEFNRVKINKWIFMPIGIVYSDFDKTIYNKFIFLVGGNILLLLICAGINLSNIAISSMALTQFNVATIHMIIVTMLPMKYSNGIESDGLQIYKLIKGRNNSID